MSNTVIKLESVSRWFRMDLNCTTTLKEYVVKLLSRKRKYKEFWALKDISFEVEKGEVIGIVGRNGAGKSTLLKIVSGILKPSKGVCKVQGNVVPMLELGSGFDFELSGKENIFLNGAILGYTKSFLKSKYNQIIEFSELGEFIDMPLKTYSSGMLARLAFSVATIVIPDVLIVDEILAVGDENFQKKSHAKMMELMQGGTTVLFVTHNLNQIKEMCDRVLWLEQGKVKLYGDKDLVCNAYQEYITTGKI